MQYQRHAGYGEKDEQESTNRKARQKTVRKGAGMKGYVVNNGYMGWVAGEYMLFADENDYREYLED